MKFRASIAALLAGLLALGVGQSGWAGGGRYYGGGHRGYGHSYGGNYHGGYHHGGHHHNNNDNDEWWALGAGLLIGGLAGYLISENRYAYYPEPRYYSYDEPAYYASPAPPVVTRVYPAPPPVVPVYSEPAIGPTCLQTREYTTTVDIDGQPREAYGTRCLQADGTWLLGPVKLVPQFGS